MQVLGRWLDGSTVYLCEVGLSFSEHSSAMVPDAQQQGYRGHRCLSAQTPCPEDVTSSFLGSKQSICTFSCPVSESLCGLLIRKQQLTEMPTVFRHGY